MGSTISKDFIPPPLTLRDCLNHDGTVNLSCYIYYSRRCDELDSFFDDRFIFGSNIKKRKYDEVDTNSFSTCRSNRSVKKHKLLVRTSDGGTRELKPEDTIWYMLYTANEPRDDRMKKLFRLRFRLPYFDFLSLSEEISKHELFSRWQSNDATGSSPSNIKLLLLGSL